MSLKLVPDTNIKILKAHCSKFSGGFCYSANGIYYSGHYETFEEALTEAKKVQNETIPS